MTHQFAKQIRSTVTRAGKLELSIVEVSVPQPKPGEVLIRIEASPINPSDLGLLIGPADVNTARVTGSGDDKVVTIDIPQARMAAMKARLDESLPVGNEGAGVVIAAGDGAEALLGKTVGVAGGEMYS